MNIISLNGSHVSTLSLKHHFPPHMMSRIKLLCLTNQSFTCICGLSAPSHSEFHEHEPLTIENVPALMKIKKEKVKFSSL